MHTHMLAIKHGIGTARQDRWKDSSEQGRRWKLKSQCQEEQLELREYHINISSHFNQKIYSYYGFLSSVSALPLTPGFCLQLVWVLLYTGLLLLTLCWVITVLYCVRCQ